MATQKTITIQGVLANTRKLGSFFGALRGPKISEHIDGCVEVTPCNDGFDVTVHIEKYDTSTADINRLLHFWKEFLIVEPEEIDYPS